MKLIILNSVRNRKRNNNTVTIKTAQYSYSQVRNVMNKGGKQNKDEQASMGVKMRVKRQSHDL